MDYQDDRVTSWTGWVVFAAALMIIEGIVQFIYGLAALFNADWFVYHNGQAYLMNITSWGWTMLLVGTILTVSGILLWSGNLFGRSMGVIFACLALVANLSILAVAPVWAILAIAVNIAVIYAILAHGSEMKTLTHH